MLIGGAELYAQTLALSDRLYLTEVDAAPDGDAFFPALDPADWRETAAEPHPADARHARRVPQQAWPAGFTALALHGAGAQLGFEVTRVALQRARHGTVAGRRAAVGRFYSETEFDLGRLDHLRPQMVEIGRSCIDADYRSGAVITLLWSGGVSAVLFFAIDKVFGVIAGHAGSTQTPNAAWVPNENCTRRCAPGT